MKKIFDELFPENIRKIIKEMRRVEEGDVCVCFSDDSRFCFIKGRYRHCLDEYFVNGDINSVGKLNCVIDNHKKLIDAFDSVVENIEGIYSKIADYKQGIVDKEFSELNNVNFEFRPIKKGEIG